MHAAPRLLGSLAALAALAGCGAAAPKSPQVRTQLVAGFAAPPLALEIAEAVAAHNSSAFFPFVLRLAQNRDVFEQPDAVVYKQSLAWIEQDALLAPFARSLLELDLSAHVYAPAVATQYQLYGSVVVPEIKAARGPQNFDDECRIWAQYKDKQACSIAALDELLNVEKFYGTTYIEEAKTEPQELAIDHVYASESAAPKVVALYADPRVDGFAEFHVHLGQLAENHEITYILRYRPWPLGGGRAERPLGLVGYGVELALKSTEYKVIDDRDLGLGDEHVGDGPKLAEQVPGNAGAELLFGSTADAAVKGLAEKQLSSLGVQATQMVISAKDKLAVLAQLSQGLPQYAHLLAETPVNRTLAEDIGNPWRRSRKDEFAINGVRLGDEDMDPFRLLEHIRKESSVIAALESAGLTQRQALGVLLHGPKDEDDSRAPVVFDMRDASLDKKVVLWFNDLEKDRRYASWPADIDVLKEASGPRMMPRVRRNVVQVIYAIDLSVAENWITIFEDILGNIEYGVPMQLGVVPLADYSTPDTLSPANRMAKVVLYLRRSFKKSEWQSLAKSALIAHLRSRQTGGGGTFVAAMRAAYETFVKTHKTRDSEEPLGWDAIAAAEPLWLSRRWQSTVDHCSRLDLSPSSAPVGLVFVNGAQLEMGDGFQQRVFGEFQMQTLALAQQLRDGGLAATDSIQDHVYGKQAIKSRSALVYASDESPLRVLPLGEPSVQKWLDSGVHYLAFASADTAAEDSPDKGVLSTWVVGDFASQRVRTVAADALAAARRERSMRVALIHTSHTPGSQHFDRAEGEEDEDAPEGHDPDAPQALCQLLAAPLEAAETLQALPRFVARFLASPDDAKASLASMGVAGEQLASCVEPDAAVADEAERAFAQNRKALVALGALPTEPHSCRIVVNGRLLPEITPTANFAEDSFVLLARHELHERARPARQALADAGADTGAADPSTLVMKTAAIVEHGKTLLGGSSGIFRRRDSRTRTDVAAQLPQNTDTYLEFGSPSDARLRIQAVLDPLSEHAQKWTPIFQTLLSLPDVSLELWLNPKPVVKELPAQRFYRYLWPTSLAFDSSGDVVDPEVAFSNIPVDPLLTLGVDAPAAWLVTAVESVHDLDNIRLSSLRGAHKEISATYKLAHILVEGHLVDTHSRAPARGLEVQLGTSSEPAITDTIVMANLGYLQLKANPGVWRFAIRPGRSADIYKIDHVGSGSWDYVSAKAAGAEAEDLRPVLVTGFAGTTIFPLVSKRAGMEAMDVLQDADADGKGASPSGRADGSGSSSGFWGRIKGTLGGGNGAKPAAGDGRPHFDVFAVASGHLYERLMSIMILSVLNNTESSVKFWLIENFLSPSFKEFVPHMAEEFGFDYEFVTYKWPHWLHHETEKQRTIWGYKILFLDVLFPLSLDRVIFVDADQIVRADLQELADMDLKGAPYGYTPFCDDRPGIDAFRFWKQGWWKDHLRGKPYHISALYVVDLKRFRQMAAGDRMRGQYQALSQDSNSLANLDQDLPNNMQHVVPIHSLPQEWLWCETWCGDSGLKTAKTIDLCNNPMTKEPKLERARRLLPEWEVFDQQVANFSRALVQRGKHEGAQIAEARAAGQPPVAQAAGSSAGDAHDEL
ncbi:killer toxin resistant protein [Coemansia biformis]|uniref:Killer toxin resistant protein n=1 Tax=Coemansia biformis TaxID=1286918 RepID=A0A9W7YAH1_9FUNG|nr:killer toxin resistant protein [Coemansia biformis]